MGCTRWIGERPEDIENSTQFQFPSRADSMFHGRMEAGREHETDADGVNTRGYLFRCQVH